MEYVDVVGPDEGVGEWRLGAAADEVLADIADRAAENDARGIDRAQIDALAAVGLVGTALDPPARQREVAERIAMVDASVWPGAAPVLRTLAAAEPATMPWSMNRHAGWRLRMDRMWGCFHSPSAARTCQPVAGGCTVGGRSRGLSTG